MNYAMNYKTDLLFLFAVIVSPGCLSANIQAEPVVVETQPVQITLAVDETITVVEKGGIINTGTVKRTVQSLQDNSPGLSLVQDHELASELSFWLDRPTAATLAEYLDKPVIKQKLDLYHLKYMVVVEHDWWGIEAQIWNLHTRKLDGVINAKALVSSSKTSCSANPGSWVFGAGATMVYIPYAALMIAALTTESMLDNTPVSINNINSKSSDTAQGEPYLSISETVVQNGSEAIKGIPIPCESTHTLRSNPAIDTIQLGTYLAGKFNQSSAIAGN